MNTLIESINKVTKIKSELNKILQDNGLDGGEVFTDYPDKFRELFRVSGKITESITEGYTPESGNVIAEVPNPVLKYDQNIVYITCQLKDAGIYYWIKTDSGNNEVGTTLLTKGNSVVMSESGTLFCYAQYEEQKSNTVSIYCPVQEIVVPEPPTIYRQNTTIIIDKYGDDDVIYYDLGYGYTKYTGPIYAVPRTMDVYAFTQNYRGRSQVVVNEAPEKPIKPETPVLDYSLNVITITCETADATIYYKRTDEQYWHVYTSAFTISETGFYIVKSIKDKIQSDESDAYYCKFIQVPEDPVITVNNNKVYITCITPDVDIYYKIGSGDYSLYTQPITLTETVTVTAYADNEGIQSDTVSQTCTYVEPVIPTAPEDPVIGFSNNIITITCSTSDAVIRYRFDTSGLWNIYTRGIEITETKTVYAYSEKDSLVSNTVSKECVYVEPVTPEIPEVPVFSCDNNTVTITCSTLNATIYYRNINDSSWTQYSGPFSISETGQYVAYSYKNGQSSASSSVFTATYVPGIVTPDDPVIGFESNVITITCDTPGVSIYYKFGSGSYQVYSGPITINSDVIVYTYASINGVSSNTVSLYCHYVGYSIEYFTIEMINNGYIYFCRTESTGYSDISVEYSMDDGNTWNTLTSSLNKIISSGPQFQNSSASRIYASAGTKVRFKGNNNSYYKRQFWVSNDFKIYGNIMTLILNNSESSLENYSFSELFFRNNKLTSAESLILPSTVTTHIYEDMFNYCTALTDPPVLPATSMAVGCYRSMFANCISMGYTPKLLAQVLDINCYESMFNGCTSLTDVWGGLPATTLVTGCYGQMFYGCSSLDSIECLASNPWFTVNQNGSTYTIDCPTYNWTYGTKSSPGIFTKNATADWNFTSSSVQSIETIRKNSGIPEQWSVYNK